MDIAQTRHLEFRGHLFDERHDFAGNLRVEGRGGFVEQKQFRGLHQGAGNADPLALSTGKLIGALVHKLQQSDPVEEAQGMLNVVPREGAKQGAQVAGVTEAAGQYIVHDAHAVDEVEFLKDHADVTPQQAQLAAPQRGDLAIEEQYFAAARLHQPVDAADQGRFAGAAGTDDGEEVVGLDAKRDALQNLRAAGGISGAKITDFQHRHAQPPGLRKQSY